MHEVKVYDSSGNLKKVISVKALTKRSDQQINSPSLYIKKGRKAKPADKMMGKDLKSAQA
ncbi:MAG: hypothetical protein HOL15_06560 [Nitrospinaceae bacterium]|nr:hypothetical protein [Nitrospina sp.]MBT5376456.1 hypothetical protein [Nitrospinaceae bacterium]MBT5868419.1 hypothetical protein [Nitrospinaceae bacterium]MBT6346173.1 hypothetical protein [Nitrospina sp.]